MFTILKKNTTEFLRKYNHAWILLYMLIYFPWFAYLEKTVTTHFNPIHMTIDDYIPFVEYFIVPYLLWFAYVICAVLYFFFQNKTDYYRLCTFLFVGMTVFLVVSTLYPNGHHLRPATFERDNIFVRMVQLLYATDTPTNLFPSIHVYNSLGVHFAICNCKELKNSPIMRNGSFLLMMSIILSTVFLKQHSVFDVITAFALAGIMYSIVYGYGRAVAVNRQKSYKKQLHHV